MSIDQFCFRQLVTTPVDNQITKLADIFSLTLYLVGNLRSLILLSRYVNLTSFLHVLVMRY